MEDIIIIFPFPRDTIYLHASFVQSIPPRKLTFKTESTTFMSCSINAQDFSLAPPPAQHTNKSIFEDKRTTRLKAFLTEFSSKILKTNGLALKPAAFISSTTDEILS